MKSFNIWKKIAAGILFLNIALTSFIGQPVAAEGTEGQPAIQRMGFSSKLSIGPGSQLFDQRAHFDSLRPGAEHAHNSQFIHLRPPRAPHPLFRYGGALSAPQAPRAAPP